MSARAFYVFSYSTRLGKNSMLGVRSFKLALDDAVAYVHV